jgi:hypothetical protein
MCVLVQTPPTSLRLQRDSIPRGYDVVNLLHIVHEPLYVAIMHRDSYQDFRQESSQ